MAISKDTHLSSSFPFTGVMFLEGIFFSSSFRLVDKDSCPWSFQKFFTYCPTAQMAEFMFPNVAYKATVYRTGIPIDFWPHCVPHLIKNLTFDAVLVKLSCWTHAGFQMKS